MGPKHDSNLCIALAFYTTQVDICGPFESYSNANKGARINIWLVVQAVACKVTDDYTTDVFILAFIRFSSRYGYSYSQLLDYGSQLIKGCKDMIISFPDVKQKLGDSVYYSHCVGVHYVHGTRNSTNQKIYRERNKQQASFGHPMGNTRPTACEQY